MNTQYPPGFHIDIDVDVICAGSGVGALATAIAFAKLNFRVLVAEKSPTTASLGSDGQCDWADTLCSRWGVPSWHRPTAKYLEDVTDDIPGPPAIVGPRHGVIASLELNSAPKPSGTVPPFVGAQLRTWAAECLQCPSGILSTQVGLPGATAAVMRSGAKVRVHEVADVPPQGNQDMTLRDWLLVKSIEMGVTVLQDTALNNLIFENGEVVGAAIGSAPEQLLVRARRGVVLGTGDPAAHIPLPAVDGSEGARLCVVSREASRFGRLALLTERAAKNGQSPRRRIRARPLAH